MSLPSPPHTPPASDSERHAIQAHLKKYKSIKKNPQNASKPSKDLYFHRGNVLYDEGKYDKAVVQYTLALDYDEKFSDCLYNRGNAYRNQGLVDKAIEDYIACLKIAPQDVSAYVKCGQACSMLSKKEGKAAWRRAIDWYDAALKIDLYSSEAYLKRGLAYRNLGESKHALVDFTCCINLPSNEASCRLKDVAEALKCRAQIRIEKNELQSAIRDLQTAVELNPDDYAS